MIKIRKYLNLIFEDFCFPYPSLTYAFYYTCFLAKFHITFPKIKDKPRGRMGIKTQTYQRIDLRTRGGGRVSWDKVREWHGHIYTTKLIASGKLIASRKQPHSTGRSAQCFVTTQRGGIGRVGGREMQEERDMGIYVYVQLIHFVIKQKLTHHCKAIILQ